MNRHEGGRMGRKKMRISIFVEEASVLAEPLVDKGRYRRTSGSQMVDGGQKVQMNRQGKLYLCV